MKLPPCGLYRTTRPLGPVAAGRLVYFHNHGDPGPGIYLPESWSCNRARFSIRGYTLADPELAGTLQPLPAQGLYRVTERFTCCDKNCRTFAPDLLVQLGYNTAAEPILFVPEWTARGLGFPERGSRLDPDRLARLAPLRVAEAEQGEDEPKREPGLLH
ncbi:MAG: hypothetical protein FJ125_16665 [Deltaproteobacteria bacterium]|nr:hypothetical protein [Deltaproteobacteria bacterium]